jgi:argininosuccinate lyase
MSKLWGGRFAEETDALMHRFNASISFDMRLLPEDIDGSVAWARALGNADVLLPEEVLKIISGLETIRMESVEGKLSVAVADEDVHSLVERRLIELVGEVGGKLHTGRSRNDQVATDFRLWVMRACGHLSETVSALQEALLDSAAANLMLPMPGYTHLQHAQPITWGHWMLSHFWPLQRDRERVLHAKVGASVLPLGSGALAGTAFPIDRDALAQSLGFARVSQNSLDAVSDRDFAVDFLYACVLIGVHLSRLAEQLILFSSAEFGFVALSDAYSTGSSLMPQKKNPDALELTRGKSGRLIGHLTGLLTTLKGLPSAYDKDLQEDKEPVFDAFDTLQLTLSVLTGLVGSLTLDRDRLGAQLESGLLATDLADYLVKRGVPFRRAHELVGHVVRRAEEEGVPLHRLSLAAYQGVSKAFAEDVLTIFDVAQALERRSQKGGTSRQALIAQLQEARLQLRRE